MRRAQVLPLVKLQRRVRSKYLQRLHCHHLAERLIFEDSLRRGLFRLVNQSAIFGMLLIAQMYTGDPSAQRGIYNTLSESPVMPVMPAPRAPSCRVPVLFSTPQLTPPRSLSSLQLRGVPAAFLLGRL